MAMPLSPQEIQELAAGYVLGDLSSAEAEKFQRLLAHLPELKSEVAELREALALIPYGLAEVLPEGGLRSQILTAAQTALSEAFPVAQVSASRRSRLPWLVSTLAGGLAIICGFTVLRLNGQVRLLQAQRSQVRSELAVAPSPDEICQTWSGRSQLLKDLQQALVDPAGPADVVVRQPAEIPSRLREFQTTVATLPLLPTQQGILLGGSSCQFGQTKGIRLTYRLETDTKVSAYQLDLAGEQFPEFQAAHLTLQQPDGTSIVLWHDDNYLYALVADLPTVELQNLVHAIERT